VGTQRSFQAMLQEYIPNELLMYEQKERSWYFKNVEMDNGWKTGNIVVPFEGSGASSISFGGLTDSTDISESQYIRGNIPTAVEAWGAIILHQRDLMENGKIPEQTFLSLIPKEIDKFTKKMKQAISTQLLVGSHFAKFTANGTVGGAIAVNHINRFDIGQKLEIDDDNSAPLSVYVIGIVMDTSTITVSLTRGGVAADVSAYTLAQNAKCYHPGVLTNGVFTSVASMLLSAANGGSATIHGVNKLLWPVLQALNYSGAAFSAANLLDSLFDVYVDVQGKGLGNASKIVLSYKHLGSIMKKLENSKGAFYVTKQPSTNVYGWTTVTIGSVKGELEVVAVLEMDDDIIMYLDLATLVFYSNGGIKKRQAPDGKEYFEIRSAANGYSYIIDLCLFGENACLNPSSNAIVYGVNY